MMVESGSPLVEGWWVSLIGAILPILGALLIVIIKYYAGKLMQRINASDAEKEAIQCLLEGMATAQEAIVRDAKKKASDGKLTKDEIEQAKQLAIGHALTVAKGPALNVLKEMSKERLGSMIKQLLAKVSKKKENK
jgi:hypothetical protein